MIYKDKSLLNDENQFAYSDDDILYDELSESIEKDRFYDFIVESVFDIDELTLESKYYFKKEIINESINVGENEISQVLGITVNDLKNTKSVEKLRNLLRTCNQKEQEEKDKLDRARAEEKGKIAVIINMIKKAIRWIKEKILRFKDTVVNTVTNRPAGYSGAVREYKKNVENSISPSRIRSNIGY